MSLVLLLAACSTRQEQADPDRLPRAVAVAMVLSGHQRVTAYFSVEPNPRGHVDVRIADGLELPGAEAVFAVEPDGDDRYSWHLTERLGGARVPFLTPGTEQVRVTRLDDRDVWLFPREGSAGWACALLTGRCRGVTEPFPELPMTRTGPGSGFRLELDDHTLRFRQPHQTAEARADVVATRVGAIVGVRWYLKSPSARVAEYIDRRFRGRGTLRAAFREVVVDGILEEWASAEPEVVDAPWQADVRTHWTGREDASFSVAALWSDEHLCLAGRIRDDVRTAKDALAIVIRKERRVISLLEPPDNAVVAREEFGWHYEACWPRPWFATAGSSVAMTVQLQDEDGTGDVDVLATAPIFGAVPIGALDLVAD
ncbi:MAG: hypothetical protein EXR71_09490 [Myxococcales bacterium]|nr:hypothetical protein [Myxococcales bacterium]